MGKHRFFLVCLFVVSALGIGAQNYNDVDSLGDVWFVTLDNSFSMRHSGGRAKPYFSNSLESVYKRLCSSEELKKIEWNSARFLFFKSGMSGNPPSHGWDSVFIKHTDKRLHSFDGPREFADYIYRIMSTELRYDNYVSFISQIRLFTLKKGVDYMNSIGESRSYRNIYVMTISDDKVDQHDLWGTDYRNLKKVAPRSINYLQHTSAKYIYNPLNGWGGGEMNPRYSSEKGDIHIWLYDYVTAQGKRVKDTAATYVDLKPLDGESIDMVLNMGDSAALCYIDRVVINGIGYHIGSYFDSALVSEVDYSNSFPFSNVTLYGRVQLNYMDSLLGPRSRMVDFVQNEKVPTVLASTIWKSLLTITLIALVCFLLYEFVLLPTSNLLTVYDAAKGGQTTVRRGFRRHWRGDAVPLMSIVTDRGLSILVRQDSHVKRQDGFVIDQDNLNDILLVSRKELRLSVDASYHCYTANDNIERHFVNAPFDYPYLLKKVYRQTSDHKLYKIYDSKNVFAKGFGWLALRVFHLFCGARYYYYLSVPVKKSITIENPILRDKFFVIENVKAQGAADGDEVVIQRALLAYYGYKTSSTEVIENVHRDNKILLACVQQGGRYMWNVFVTVDSFNSSISLLNVRWIYTYSVNQSKSDFAFEKMKLLKVLRSHYHVAPNFIHVKIAIGMQELQSMSVLPVFSVSESECKNFVVLISTDTSRRITAVYNPFTDGYNTTSRFRLPAKLEHYVYSSFLSPAFIPQDNEQYFTKMSPDVVDCVPHEIPNAEFTIDGQGIVSVNNVRLSTVTK